MHSQPTLHKRLNRYIKQTACLSFNSKRCFEVHGSFLGKRGCTRRPMTGTNWGCSRIQLHLYWGSCSLVTAGQDRCTHIPSLCDGSLWDEGPSSSIPSTSICNDSVDPDCSYNPKKEQQDAWISQVYEKESDQLNERHWGHNVSSSQHRACESGGSVCPACWAAKQTFPLRQLHPTCPTLSVPRTGAVTSWNKGRFYFLKKTKKNTHTQRFLDLFLRLGR